MQGKTDIGHLRSVTRAGRQAHPLHRLHAGKSAYRGATALRGRMFAKNSPNGRIAFIVLDLTSGDFVGPSARYVRTLWVRAPTRLHPRLDSWRHNRKVRR
jgi:hypothetical protein